jgi:epoxide hydrolase-like protein
MDTVTVNRRRLLVLSATATLALSSRPASSQSAEETIVPFTYHAEDAALLDLKRRLDGTRWPEHETAEGWEQGPPLSACRSSLPIGAAPMTGANAKASLPGGHSSRRRSTVSAFISFTFARATPMPCRSS